MPSERDVVIVAIRDVFAEVPRPEDDQLLHPSCMDDGDIEWLYGRGAWAELVDEGVEPDYASLAFLSPEGFRHFLPLYMIWSLNHPDSLVADSTVYALTPIPGDLHVFMTSKWSTFDDAQTAAVVAFLRELATEEAEAALESWAD